MWKTKNNLQEQCCVTLVVKIEQVFNVRNRPNGHIFLQKTIR